MHRLKGLHILTSETVPLAQTAKESVDVVKRHVRKKRKALKGQRSQSAANRHAIAQRKTNHEWTRQKSESMVKVAYKVTAAQAYQDMVKRKHERRLETCSFLWRGN